MKIKQGIYTHIKSGRCYEVLFTGLLESNMSDVVIYKGYNGLIWVRSLEEFKERFKYARHERD